MVVEWSKDYPYQLTKWLPKEAYLKFALKHFEQNEHRHCAIKKSVRGYAIFTDGSFMRAKHLSDGQGKYCYV